MEATPLLNDIKIRPFDGKKDFENALLCFNEGFRHILWPFIDHAAPDFHMDCIRLFHKMSKTSFVAEIDGEVHGLLLGAAPFKFRDILSAVGFLFFSMVPKVLVNAYQFTPLAYKHLLRCIYGFSFFIFLHPASTAISEITLFTSQKKYRGRGMGRLLMDAYLDAAKKRGAKEATVCTDTALSYHFYESYGFERIREFNMKAYKYSIPKEFFTGIIYRIDTDSKRRHMHGGL